MANYPTNNQTNNQEMTQSELFKQAFYYLNTYKRHRALAQIAHQDGNRDKKNFHDLKQYQTIDGLELALRALQKGHRDLQAELEDESQ